MNNTIKMIIAGEEVVSNNEFTINEEMLSASSTILNNCYPKSWELTKDYTSNFYYPKDYSKFLLGEGEFLHGIEEYAPLEVSGKNLLNNILTTQTVSGVSFVVNNDGTINVSGVATAQIVLTISPTINLTGTYRLSGCASGGSSSTYELQFYGSGNTVDYGNNIAISNNPNGVVRLVIRNGATLNNLVFKPMFVKGSEATTYEPYNQPNLTYETNVEKEWNTFNVYGRTYQETRSGKNMLKLYISGSGSINGINYTVNSDGSITFNGTATNIVYLNLNNHSGYYDHFENGQVYTSYLKNAGNAVRMVSRYVANTTTYLYTSWGDEYGIHTYNGTTNQDSFTYLTINTGTQVNNLTVYPMIVKGSYNMQTIGNYEPYGVMPSPDYPSELISVGYENLFDIETWVTKGNNSTYYSYENGKLKIKSLDDRGLSRFVESEKVILPNGTYTISGYNANGLRVYNNGTDYPLVNQPTFEVTLGYVYLKFVSSTVVECQPIITKGTQAHSYIPYGKYGIEIANIGKNLFDKNNAIITNGFINAPSKVFTTDSSARTLTINCQPNTTYTISKIASARLRIGSGTTLLYNNSRFTNAVDASNQTSYTFTTGENDIYLSVFYYLSSLDTLTEQEIRNSIQIEKGTQATTYEAYKGNSQLYILDEPLRAVGNYKDKLYTDGRVLYVKREVGYKKITSNMVVAFQNVLTNSKEARVNITSIENITNSYELGNIMSNSFKAQTTWNNDIIGIMGFAGNPISQIAFRIPKNDTATFFDNNVVYLQYALNNSIIEPLGYIDLPSSYEGQNNVSIYTGLDTRTELWYYWKNYNVLFAGVVKNSGDISLNPRHPHYCSLQILDYKTFLSESNTLDFVIANKTVSEAIVMVVNAVAGYGFVVGDIDIDSANDIIGAYSTLNKTAYDVLQYLANISGSRWRARYVDETTTAIDFYDPDTLPQGANIEYTKQYWETNNIVDLSFNYGTRDYRNKQILLSDEVYANINYDETLISNGYSNTFTLQNNVGTIVKITINGDEKTVATTNDKQMGVDADFYYTPGKNIIESNIIYSAGIMIHLTYQPLVKGRQIVYNTTEVNRISNQTDTTGVIARYETRNDILSSDELEKIAKTYIEYKGKAEVILTLTTQNKDLYDIGEIVYFNAPIDDLKQNYMVKTKKIEYVVINEIINLFYVYELTSSFNSEKAINYFDNQRNKASGNISEGESITRNIDIETQALISWYEGTVSSASITVTGDNVLNSALNSPFVE